MNRPVETLSSSAWSPAAIARRGRPRRILTLVVLAALGAAVGRGSNAASAPAPIPAPAPAAPANAASQTFTVTARLVEIPSKFPSDDLYDYVYVMRYEGVGGEWDKKPLFVGHYKPREARSALKDDMKKVVSGKVRSFHQGDVHKLLLTSPLKAVWKGAVVDEFAATDRKSIRYFALVADPS